MSDIALRNQASGTTNEARSVVFAFIAMLAMLALWVWILFDVVQPWLDAV